MLQLKTWWKYKSTSQPDADNDYNPVHNKLRRLQIIKKDHKYSNRQNIDVLTAHRNIKSTKKYFFNVIDWSHINVDATQATINQIRPQLKTNSKKTVIALNMVGKIT